jgi:hypothetical protein
MSGGPEDDPAPGAGGPDPKAQAAPDKKVFLAPPPAPRPGAAPYLAPQPAPRPGAAPYLAPQPAPRPGAAPYLAPQPAPRSIPAGRWIALLTPVFIDSAERHEEA